MTTTDGRTPPTRICVFRALQLGDMVCATPALRALRRGHPEAEITLVGLPWAASFSRRLRDCVDRFVPFPGWPGLPERGFDVEALSPFLLELRAHRFDLAVQLHGSGQLTNPLVQAFGAQRTVGFRPADAATSLHGSPDWWPYPDRLHEVHRNLRLMAHLGLPADDDRVAFPLLPEDHDELRERRPDLAALEARRYACVHPGARDPAKRWAPEEFARVGDRLAEAGLQVVITGSGAEAELAAEVARRMHHPALHAACDISVGALAVVLSGARLLVSNDTGVVHVAAGLAVPSVVIFFATDPSRWAPLDRKLHVVVHEPAGVDPAHVLAAVDRQLNQVPAGYRAAA